MSKENDFSEQMAGYTDRKLHDYVDNPTKYQGSAVKAAIRELEKRGIKNEYFKDIEQQIEQCEIEKERRKEEDKKKESRITDDPNAPLLYHSKFIYTYGVLFSVLGGGILMSMNLRKLNKTNISRLVILTSVLYVVVQAILFSYIEKNTGIVMLVSALGMVILERLFWKKNIPQGLEYRKRSIWTPLVIGISISGLFIYAAFAGV